MEVQNKNYSKEYVTWIRFPKLIKEKLKGEKKNNKKKEIYSLKSSLAQFW